jgi:hypothetical protein
MEDPDVLLKRLEKLINLSNAVEMAIMYKVGKTKMNTDNNNRRTSNTATQTAEVSDNISKFPERKKMENIRNDRVRSKSMIHSKKTVSFLEEKSNIKGNSGATKDSIKDKKVFTNDNFILESKIKNAVCLIQDIVKRSTNETFSRRDLTKDLNYIVETLGSTSKNESKSNIKGGGLKNTLLEAIRSAKSISLKKVNRDCVNNKETYHSMSGPKDISYILKKAIDKHRTAIREEDDDAEEAAWSD